MTIYYVDPVAGDNVNSGNAYNNAKKDLTDLGPLATVGDEIRVLETHDPIITIPGGPATTPNSGGKILTFNQAIGCRELWYSHNNNSTVWTAYNAVALQNTTDNRYAPSYYGHSTGTNFTYFYNCPQTTNTKLAVCDLGSTIDLSGYKSLLVWIGGSGNSTGPNQTSPAYIDDDCFRLKLCSDSLGDVVISNMDFEIKFHSPTYFGGHWMEFTPVGNVLPNNIRSMAFYSGNVNFPGSLSVYCCVGGAYALTAANTIRPGGFVAPTDIKGGRRYWDKICRITGGESTTVNLYMQTIATGSADSLPPGTREWEYLFPTRWHTRSDFTAASIHRIPGWDISNFSAAFDQLDVVGGCSRIDGTPGTGYTIFDIGGTNVGGYGVAIYGGSTTVRDIHYQNFIVSGGAYSGLVYFNWGSTTQVKYTYTNVHRCPGDLQYPTGVARVGDGSVFTECSSSEATQQTELAGGDANAVSVFDRCIFIKPLTLNLRVQNGIHITRDCEFYGPPASTSRPDFSYTSTGRHVFEGTNKFVNCSQLTISTVYEEAKDFGTMEFWGSGFNWYIGANHTVDGLKLVSHVDGWPARNVYMYTNASAGSGSTKRGTATANKFINWDINYAANLRVLGGVFEDCNLRTLALPSIQEDDETQTILSNCTIGRPDDSGTCDWFVYNAYSSLYGCSLNRIRFRNYAGRGRIKMVGGSLSGTGFTPFYNATGTTHDHPYQGWLFHNVTSPDWSIDGMIDADWQSNTNAQTECYYADEWWALSGYDGNPTNLFLAHPYCDINSTTEQLRSPGGRSLRVNFKNPIPLGTVRYDIVTVALRGGVLATATLWVYTVTADTYVYFRADREQIGVGQGLLEAVSSSSVGVWEELSISFTPSSDGVIVFHVAFEGPKGTAPNMYLDDISVIQN